MSWTGRRRSALAGCVVAATTVLTGCGSLADAFRPTAYCSPDDPVVTPASATPGEELHVEISGVGRHPECTSTLPAGARYGISITSEVSGTSTEDDGSQYYAAELAVLDPDDGGAAAGTVRVPDDAPAGPATISVDLQYAKTLCEILPDASCAPLPSALVEVVD